MRILRCFSTVSVAALLAIACNTSPASPSGGSVVVLGRVLDFVTGAAVPSATVTIGDAQGSSDREGRYTVNLPGTGRYEPYVNGQWAGTIFVTGPSYRGDLFVNTGTCVSRYGIVADAQTLTPVAGATVHYFGPAASDSTTTGPDGWYRLDLGCPPEGVVGSNTMFIVASHPNYADDTESVGRGVRGVARIDLVLQRK